MNIIKYVMGISNMIFVITGIIIIAVGAVIQGYQGYDHILDDKFSFGPGLLIATGAIILVVSFFGCCGAFKDNYCMTVTYIVFLVIIFILELGAGLAGYVTRDHTRELVEAGLNKTLLDNTTESHKFWDDIQTSLHCCGINSPNDWPSYNITVNTLPQSCCPTNQTTCDKSDKTHYTIGCLDEASALLIKDAGVLGGVAIFIATIQLIGVIFACYQARSIRRNYETV